MKRFKYKAKEKSTGKILKGVIQAEDEQTAGRLLIEQGYVPQCSFLNSSSFFFLLFLSFFFFFFFF